MESKYMIIFVLSCLLAACAGKQTKHNEMQNTRHIDTIGLNIVMGFIMSRIS